MRYAKDHKENTRMAVIEQGAKLIKLHGLGGTSVGQIMAAGGLSGAAMYSHFESKAGLIEAILSSELERSKRLFNLGYEQVSQTEHMGKQNEGVVWCKAVLKVYFNLPFVRDMQNGCILPALGQELLLHEPRLQEIYVLTVSEISNLIGRRTGRPALADGVLTTAMGAVSMARMTSSDERAKNILSSASGLILKALSV
jgi:TetR/AcrR family transcriptional regulator, transcriptional repressor for nem operon